MMNRSEIKSANEGESSKDKITLILDQILKNIKLFNPIVHFKIIDVRKYI